MPALQRVRRISGAQPPDHPAQDSRGMCGDTHLILPTNSWCGFWANVLRLHSNHPVVASRCISDE